jgi:hypothetical protein
MNCQRLSFVLLLLLGISGSVLAQMPPRFEVGTILACVADCNDHPNWGWGGRGAFNLTSVFAVEGQVFDHHPSRDTSPSDPLSRADILTTFDLKATWRLERRYKFNLFGTAGPGFIRTTKQLDNGLAGTTYTRDTLPLIDLGGGAEFVPLRNVAIRVDFTHFTISNPCTTGSDYCFLPSFSSQLNGATTARAALMFRFR